MEEPEGWAALIEALNKVGFNGFGLVIALSTIAIIWNLPAIIRAFGDVVQGHRNTTHEHKIALKKLENAEKRQQPSRRLPNRRATGTKK